MKKYLISLDLDNTILNKKSKISLIDKIGLKSLLQNGHYIILNSGRPYQGMIKYIKQLKLYNYPFIASNGGAIYYLNRQEKVVKCISFSMRYQILNDFFNEIKDYVIYVYFQGVYDTFFYNEEQVPFYMKHPHKNVNFININQFLLDQNMIHVSFAIKANFKEKMEKIIKKFRYKELSFVFWSQKNNIAYYDLQSTATNKGLAMIYLAKKLKISEDRLFAFGDDLNDIPMLQLAKHGFLMPNQKKLQEKYNLPVINKNSNQSGVIRFLFKNYRYLF